MEVMEPLESLALMDMGPMATKSTGPNDQEPQASTATHAS